MIHVQVTPVQDGESTLYSVALVDDKRGLIGKEYMTREIVIAQDLAQRMARDRKLPLKDLTEDKP